MSEFPRYEFNGRLHYTSSPIHSEAYWALPPMQETMAQLSQEPDPDMRGLQNFPDMSGPASYEINGRPWFCPSLIELEAYRSPPPPLPKMEYPLQDRQPAMIPWTYNWRDMIEYPLLQYSEQRYWYAPTSPVVQPGPNGLPWGMGPPPPPPPPSPARQREQLQYPSLLPLPPPALPITVPAQPDMSPRTTETEPRGLGLEDSQIQSKSSR